MFVFTPRMRNSHSARCMRALVSSGVGAQAVTFTSKESYERVIQKNAPDLIKDPESEVFQDMMDADVKRALDSLPHDYKMVVLLADIEGFSYKEIAEILDVPIGTVMSRIHRGRRALQKKLWDYAERNNLRPRVDSATGG